jgi:osmoprotectant transport system ATP-binding protein
MRVGGELAQFGPPDELLRAPTSPFAESFLGNERALRRLALRRVSDAKLAPVPATRDGLPTVPGAAPLREALDALIAQGVATVLVTDDDGTAVGALDVVAIAGALHE